MKSLQIVRAKPNPRGKDRNRYGTATPTQLAAEWVDFRNVGYGDVNLQGVELYHLAYGDGGQSRWEKVMDFKGVLRAGKVVRVHSGATRDLSIIAAEDLAGADHHLFTGQDRYVWNNAEGDCPSLRDAAVNEWIDQASYDPFPPEGAVLVRSGAKLVRTTTTSALYR